jgi:hypothetical protein
MHLHLPKPPHGWREFISEILVIVIGISIAIGAEQTVEWVHHRSEVNEAIVSLREESIENRDTLAYSLAELQKAIIQTDGRLAVLGNCEAPPIPASWLAFPALCPWRPATRSGSAFMMARCFP